MSRRFLNPFIAGLLVVLGITQFLAFRTALRQSDIPALECGGGCVKYVSPPGTVLDLSRGSHLIPAEAGREAPFSGDFDVHLEVKAGLPTGDWRVFFLRGEEAKRLPLLALHPRENRLHLRVSSARYWNDGTDSGLLLPGDQWVMVNWKYRRDGTSLLILENREENHWAAPAERGLIGALSDFGKFTSVAFPKVSGVQVRNFSLIHN